MAMMASGQPGSGAAQRRRGRRLRSWWRHEQQSIAMALAAATHHTAQRNGAPRSQTTATRAREVEEHETNDALWRQTAPPPGARPGILVEPVPQRSDRTVRYSSGVTPLLAVPSLAGGDGADDTAVAFLVRQTLLEREKVKRKEKEQEQEKQEKKEEVLCSLGASLAQLYGDDWKQRGQGDAKLLLRYSSVKVCFVLQDERSLQIVAQFRVGDGCDLDTTDGSGRSLFCSPTVVSDGERRYVFYNLRFASKELALRFKGEFDKAKMRMRGGPG